MGNVIGSGAIADRFASYGLQSRYLIFAGSTHNSSITNAEDISREELTLKMALDNVKGSATFVYFSSCSIDDATQQSSPYVLHKKRMEAMVELSAQNYLIVRLPQVIGLLEYEGGLVNRLVNAIRSGERFKLWRDAYRNFIDLDHAYSIVHWVLQEKVVLNSTINVANPSTTQVSELVRTIEEIFGQAANYELMELGSQYEIDIGPICSAIQSLGIDFGPGYLPRSIRKYYGYLLKHAPLLSIIVPTYNQALGINEFYRRTKLVLNHLKPRFSHEFIFVNDFSVDETLLKLKELASTDHNVKVVSFARNFGNQIAITAGIEYCQGDLAVIIDDDLQDPPEIIFDLITKWYEGYEVVFGVRPNRHGINPLFKITAKWYYRFIGALSDTKIPNDTGDFRLIDKVVIDQLRLMKEENRYYRGMVAWVGFRQTGYNYERDKRYAGVSNFSFRKYVNFALNGLTSFTDKPLYFSSLVGFIITAISFLLATYLIISKLLNPEISIQGWTSLMTIIMFFGGVQLFSIGIVGVYISKIYREVKRRPLFIVQDLVNIKTVAKVKL